MKIADLKVSVLSAIDYADRSNPRPSNPEDIASTSGRLYWNQDQVRRLECLVAALAGSLHQYDPAISEELMSFLSDKPPMDWK